MVKNVKIVVEKHADGYVAYPVGLKGVVVAQGDTYEEAVADAQSAIKFHIETFGNEVVDDDGTNARPGGTDANSPGFQPGDC